MVAPGDDTTGGTPSGADSKLSGRERNRRKMNAPGKGKAAGTVQRGRGGSTAWLTSDRECIG